MAFEGLSDRLEATFKNLRSKGSLTEADVRSAMREVRMALLEADVNYKVAKDFTNTVTEKAIGEKVMESLTPSQMVIKIVREELVNLMGGTNSRLACANHPPTIVLMCGLQGSGKTTHCAKLALMLKNQNHRPMLVACDIYRPAAIKQLQVVGEQVGVPVFEMGQTDAVKIAKAAVDYAKEHGHDYVIIDTAGRLHVDEALMNELKAIKAEVKPHEILLVVDAMTGQDAVNAATAFDEALGIDGVVLDPWSNSASLDGALLNGLLHAGHTPEGPGAEEAEAGKEAARAGHWAAAAECYQKAAEQGNSAGLSLLGECLYQGRGVPKSAAQARKMWKAAAESGEPVALLNLGDDCAARGDNGKALLWYRRARQNAAAVPDIEYTPRVCLRLAQFETRYTSRKKALVLAAEAKQAFTILQREHEPDADRWLQEAEQLLYELTHEPPTAPAAYNIESLQLD